MTIKRLLILFLILAPLVYWISRAHEPKRVDPRYALVVGEQIKHRIEFLFIPQDVSQNDTDIVKNVLFPAISLISYAGPETSSQNQK